MIILVTGGCGFIGTNFIRHALKKRPSWNIINLDALTYSGNPANLASMPEDMAARYSFVHGDIRDSDLLENLFVEHKINAVIHFAAESHVDRSILGPDAFVETNVLGTFRLLDTALKHWKSHGENPEFRFLHVSTDEVYGSLGKTGAFTEKTPYDPSSPYSASKAAADHFASAYFRTYGLPVLITNSSNNYGPYQFPEKLIPLTIFNIIGENPVPVYGDGKNIRDWIYVIDHCEALISLLDRGKPGETYNIGAGAERKNIEVVHRLCDILDERLGRGIKISSRGLIRFVTDRPGHDRRYAIDASKIHKDIGWKAAYSFDKALAATVDWYLKHDEWVESVKSGAYRKWIKLNYETREQMAPSDS